MCTIIGLVFCQRLYLVCGLLTRRTLEPAKLIYETSLRLPGEFFVSNDKSVLQSEFFKEFRSVMQQIRPTITTNHSKAVVFNHKSLADCNLVFVRHGTVKSALTFFRNTKTLREVLCFKTKWPNI